MLDCAAMLATLHTENKQNIGRRVNRCQIASVSAMTAGAFQIMLVSKLKTIAATLLTIGAIASAMGIYASQAADPASTLPPQTAAATPVPERTADIVGGSAADIEELLRRVRQEQARGDIDAAMRDLHRIERLAAQWRLALAHRTDQRADSSNGRPTGKGSAPSVNRGQMERLVDQMMSTDLELFRVESELSTLESATRTDEKDLVQDSKQQEQFERRIREELESINDLKLKLQTLKAQKSKQAEVYRKLKIDEKVASDDASEATFLKHERKDLLKSDDHLKTNLEELEFKTSQENRSPEAPKPGSTEDRLGQLERKIDRLLLALGKDLNEKLGPIPTDKPANAIAPPPPDLLGRITKVDSRAGIVEINIGSDDGLAPSH
jgi:hypothetical protein